MNTLDLQYQNLLRDILANGVTKEDRTGTGTISVFGRQIRHKMSEGFPLLTTKKMAWKTMVTELLWFLRGDTNIKFLVDNGCHIWDGDAYKNYITRYNKGEYVGKTKLLENSKKNRTLTEPFTQEEFINKIKTDDEFAKKWGELGPVYGKQWRSWEKTQSYKVHEGGDDYSIEYRQSPIDQIQNLINDLKTNPDSRRLMVNAWNVGELDQMVLPPCHYGFQVYTRELSLAERLNLASTIIGEEKIRTHEDNLERVEKLNIPTRAISLMWNQRSVDTFLGLPFNIASYGLLLEIIAKEVNMVPDELIGNLGDVHLYANHIDQAKEQIGRDLTCDERIELASTDIHFDPSDFGIGSEVSDESIHAVCDLYGVPRKSRQPFELPTLDIKLHFNNEPSFVPEHWLVDDFEIVNYQSHPAIKAPLSN